MPRQKGENVNLVSVGVRIKPEQDLLLTIVSRMRGIDKSSLVVQALDAYIAGLPDTIKQSLTAAAGALTSMAADLE